MTPEKRVWVASLLSVLLLVVYAQFLSRYSATSQPTEQPTNAQQLAPIQPQASLVPLLKADEETIALESSALRLEVGKTTAAIHELVLKEFQNIAGESPLLVSTGSGVLMAGFGDEPGSWVLEEQRARQAVWRRRDQDGVTEEFVLELDEALPIFTATLNVTNRSSTAHRVPVRIVATWSRADTMGGHYNLLEAVFRTEQVRPWQKTHLRYPAGARDARHVPRRTSIATLSERFFCQALRLDHDNDSQVSMLPAERGAIAAQIASSLTAAPNATTSYSVAVYVGPRDFFRLRDAGFEQAFPLGFLTRIGLILLLLLNGIASVVRNYGLAIVILAALVTAALSPFTLLSVRSMKKLQELQPKMDQVKRKHAKDAQRMNQEILALFREHRVSPLSGCLPMLLQMPVFFALWAAISHAIELRGQPFLWIMDLSLPDRLARLPFGFDLNILPILMAGAMFVQTKLSQPKVAQSGTNLFSGPLMSVVFGVMFYQVPSGLVLYWLTNSLSSILLYKLAKIS